MKMANRRKTFGSSKSYSLTSLASSEVAGSDWQEVPPPKERKGSKKLSSKSSAILKLRERPIAEEDVEEGVEEDENQNHMTFATSSFQAGSKQAQNTDKSLFNVPLDHSFRKRFAARRSLSAGFLPSSSEESLDAVSDEGEGGDSVLNSTESKQAPSLSIPVSARTKQNMGRSWSLSSVVGSIRREKSRPRLQTMAERNAPSVEAAEVKTGKLEGFTNSDGKTVSDWTNKGGAVAKVQTNSYNRKENSETLGFETIDTNSLRSKHFAGSKKQKSPPDSSFGFSSLRRKPKQASKHRPIFAFTDSPSKSVNVGILESSTGATVDQKISPEPWTPTLQVNSETSHLGNARNISESTQTLAKNDHDEEVSHRNIHHPNNSEHEGYSSTSRSKERSGLSSLHKVPVEINSENRGIENHLKEEHIISTSRMIEVIPENAAVVDLPTQTSQLNRERTDRRNDELMTVKERRQSLNSRLVRDLKQSFRERGDQSTGSHRDDKRVMKVTVSRRNGTIHQQHNPGYSLSTTNPSFQTNSNIKGRTSTHSGSTAHRPLAKMVRRWPAGRAGPGSPSAPSERPFSFVAQYRKRLGLLYLLKHRLDLLEQHVGCSFDWNYKIDLEHTGDSSTDCHPGERTVSIGSATDEDQDDWSTSEGSFIMERANSISSVNSGGKMDGGADEIVDGLGVLNALIKVRVGTVDLQKRMCFPIQQKVWEAKLQVLNSCGSDVQDGLNYGFFILPANNRAGKFLDDERRFKEYNIDSKAGLEFKFKKRVYRQMNIDFAQVRKNHSKSNLRSLLDSIKNKDTAKLEKLLADKLIDPNFVAESVAGETPLTIAASLDKADEIIKLLVANGAHLDFRNKHGQTALHKSVEKARAKNTELLLDLGASPNYRDAKGLTPVYYSVIHGGDPACLSVLVKDHAELDVADDKGWRELHQACRYGRIQHIETLLAYGADKDAQNEAGNTPLHVCASYDQVAAARILLFRGASKVITNEASQTAYQVAIVSSNFDIAENIKNFSEDQVVRMQEEPVYKPRRRWAHNMAPLNRTSSEPFIAKDLDQISVRSRTSANSVPLQRMDSGSSGFPSPPGHRKLEGTPPPNREYVAIQDYRAEEAGEISFSRGDVVDVTAVAEDNYLEGSVHGRVGWFPSHVVQEKKKMPDPGMNNGKNSPGLSLADTHSSFFEPRVAVLSRGKKGFGFVLRGAKSPKNPTIEFVPTKEFPALQYLESVDKGSPADKAGLLKGDFVLELNGEDVRAAPHQQVVHMVVTAPDTMVMKVVTAPNIRGQETLERLAAKHPKKLSRFQQRHLSSYESDTWSVCSGSVGEMDLRDNNQLIRPEVEIISIVSTSSDGTDERGGSSSNRPISSFFEDELMDQFGEQDQGSNTATLPRSVGATPGGHSHLDDQRNWQSTLPSHATRPKPQRPTMPPPPPSKSNTVSRINSGHGDHLRHQAMQASQDRSTAFEVELADGAMSDGARRYSAGSDSAVSSSRSSPASSYSNTTSSTTSGTDSAVNMLYDRMASDPGVQKPLAKKPLPPPPLRSSSLPVDEDPYGGARSEPVASPTEAPKTGFAAMIAKAAAEKNKKVAPGSDMQATQPASTQSAVATNAGNRVSSDMTAFEIAMMAKEKTMRRQSSTEGLPAKPPKPTPEQQQDGSSDLMAAIAKRKAKVDSQQSSDIESKIKNFKNDGHNRVSEESAPLADALAKRRSTMEQGSSDESSESPHGSPVHRPPAAPVKHSPAADVTPKPGHKPPPPPVKVKEKPPPPRPKVAQKPRPQSKEIKPSQPPSQSSSSVSNESSSNAQNGSGIVLPPPAMYNDHSLERNQSSETGSVSSSQSSLSTVSNMSTDPSSSSSESTDRQDTFDSSVSLQSNSSTSSSVVTVKSTSDPENVGSGDATKQEGLNGKDGSPNGVTSKPAAEWSCAEVSEWLESINMAVYVNEFVENEISGEHLLSLTKEDLVELGVKKLAHKKDIMKAIEQLS